MKVKLCCPSCGDTGIHRDATAYWDFDTQRWELSEPAMDQVYCNACAWEGNVNSLTQKSSRLSFEECDTALCILEAMIDMEFDRSKTSGLCETRQRIIDDWAPKLEAAYNKIPQNGNVLLFDLEIVPEAMSRFLASENLNWSQEQWDTLIAQVITDLEIRLNRRRQIGSEENQ